MRSNCRDAHYQPTYPPHFSYSQVVSVYAGGMWCASDVLLIRVGGGMHIHVYKLGVNVKYLSSLSSFFVSPSHSPWTTLNTFHSLPSCSLVWFFVSCNPLSPVNAVQSCLGIGPSPGACESYQGPYPQRKWTLSVLQKPSPANSSQVRVGAHDTVSPSH